MQVEKNDAHKTFFERAGYTSETVFSVLNPEGTKFEKGELVKISKDDGSECPPFVSEKGVLGFLYLPEHGATNYSDIEDLEVFVGEKSQ